MAGPRTDCASCSGWRHPLRQEFPRIGPPSVRKCGKASRTCWCSGRPDRLRASPRSAISSSGSSPSPRTCRRRGPGQSRLRVGTQDGRGGGSSSSRSHACSMVMPSMRGIGFAGARGSPAASAVARWAAGRATIKAFVQEAVYEAMELESALARRRTESRSRCCIMPRSVPPSKTSRSRFIPFLGCGRLEDPLNRYPVTAVVHGHAHNGARKAAQPRDAGLQRLPAPDMPDSP